MTDPNEDINEELSTGELKSVSGGVFTDGGLRSNDFKKREGSGSGMTLKDWKRRNSFTWEASSD